MKGCELHYGMREFLNRFGDVIQGGKGAKIKIVVPYSPLAAIAGSRIESKTCVIRPVHVPEKVL